MDPAERAREVAAELAIWSRCRWCHTRISPSRIDDIVKTIDTARVPRTRIVDEVRDAARLSLQLYADFTAKRAPDNDRISKLAASIDPYAGTPERAELHSNELRTLAESITAAASAARNAIGTALHELARDCSIDAFQFRHTFTSPVYAFEYRGRTRMVGIEHPSPYLGVTELYLAGCFPLGYLDDHFVVFAP